eukprot:81387_1
MAVHGPPFKDLTKNISQVIDGIRTPKMWAMFCKLKRTGISRSSSSSERDDNKNMFNETKSFINQAYKIKQEHNVQNMQKKVSKPLVKSKKPTFWESSGMIFGFQDTSHFLASCMDSLAHGDEFPSCQYKDKLLSPHTVFNPQISFDIDYNKHSQLNRTQYKLKQQNYCYNCYKIITHFVPYKCIKCKLVTYCSKQCRILNKRYHSYSCSTIDSFKIKRIANMSSQKCMEKIEENMKHPTWKITFYLKRILFILKFGERKLRNQPTLSINDIALKLHTASRMYNAQKHLWIRYINVFWSCYGIPEFLLNTPFIRHNRINIYKKYNFPPNYLKLNDLTYFEYRQLCHLNSNDKDIYSLAFFVANMLCNTITDESTKPMHTAPSSSCWVFVKSNFLSINQVPMFNVVVKRMIDMYSDIHVVEDCGDSFCSFSNVIENLFVHNVGFDIYTLLGFNLDYMLLNTTFMDCIVNKMKSEFNKRAATNLFKYVVRNIDAQTLWKKDKYISTYYVLLLRHFIKNPAAYQSEVYDYTKENEYNNELTKQQLKFARICITKMIPKNYNIQYISKWVLLHHYQQPRDDSIDEWRSTMHCHSSFIKFTGNQSFSSGFNHYSFDFEINDMFFWSFVYFYSNKFGYDLMLLIQYFERKKRGETIFELLQMIWNNIEYDYHTDEHASYYQIRNNKILTIILSKCIHQNKFKESYKFWMDIKSNDNVIHDKNLKHEKDRQYKYILKICANPICSNTLRKLRKKDKNAIFYKCKKCKVFYCCRKCQKIHWKYGHKTHCKLSTIK